MSMPWSVTRTRRSTGKLRPDTVTVLFGGADGRIGEGGRRVLTQLDLGETPESGDHFGWSVSIYSSWYFEDMPVMA